MRAEDVGWQTNRMVMGKHSGRNAFKTRLQELGYEFANDDEINESFSRFKVLADKKHDIFDEDLLALVGNAEFEQTTEMLKLVDLNVSTKLNESPKAEVSIEFDGEVLSSSAEGDGAVDAVFKAIKNILDVQAELQLYSVNAITEGTESQGVVTVRIAHDGKVANGNGVDTDIIIASAKSYLSAISRLPTASTRTHPQMSGPI